MKLSILCLLPWSATLLSAFSGAKFLGPEPCELCHKDVAARQEKTAMANTWQGTATSWLPADVSIADDFAYRITQADHSISYSVDFGSGHKLTLPVAFAMGGRRHGLGFLSPVEEVEGIPLARKTLVQARYAWSQDHHKVLLAPGCVKTMPTSLEAALGVVLSPAFEARCLACHGEPNQQGAGSKGGVHCEACHGAGSEHLAGVAKGQPAQGIINPKRLPNEESIAVCARCHVGLTKFQDPSPDDLLIANQARAIQDSECYLQSRKGFSCTACHDPHSDATDDRKATETCLGCHSSMAARHAAICPVSAKTGCIGCHMPAVDEGPLHLVDHLIRVHPDGHKYEPAAKSLVPPVSEYLRMIAANSGEAAGSARTRIETGEDFYRVAREVSVDGSAAIGGYLGRKNISDLEAGWREAAARLSYGEMSPVLRANGRWILLQRLPRDFRWSAEQLQNQAQALAAQGDAAGAIGKSQQALMIYPQFLRALVFIGTTFAQSGNAKKGADVLTVASHLYPNDGGAEFALASSLSAMGDLAGARQGYRRVIELEGDFTAAYLNLGMMSLDAGDWTDAIQQFRQGLQIDPMSAELNYELSVALTRDGQTAAASQALALARKLKLSAEPSGFRTPAIFGEIRTSR